jgi:hypothetical protein
MDEPSVNVLAPGLFVPELHEVACEEALLASEVDPPPGSILAEYVHQLLGGSPHPSSEEEE